LSAGTTWWHYTVRHTYAHRINQREATLVLVEVKAEEFDRLVRPESII
jgi:hypothetical protein